MGIQKISCFIKIFKRKNCFLAILTKLDMTFNFELNANEVKNKEKKNLFLLKKVIINSISIQVK
ncbi:hypothetical protein B8T70_22345 [Flavobacterium sp. AJR]|nr:hypothetical protein B8T70_22345 [Flavobacterium sp. AJR]